MIQIVQYKELSSGKEAVNVDQHPYEPSLASKVYVRPEILQCFVFSQHSRKLEYSMHTSLHIIEGIYLAECQQLR